MLKNIKTILSIALILVQLYIGYVTYKIVSSPKEAPQVSTQIIKEQIYTQGESGQAETQNQPEPIEQKDEGKLPEEHPELINLSPEATVNGLTIGKSTTAQATAALGQPMTVHQQSVYIYEGINLYFKNNILDGFIFPGPNGGFALNYEPSSFKTSSGLQLGTPLPKVFEKYGSKTALGSGKITYQDKSNGYVLNISHQDNKIIAIEVLKK